MSDHYQLDKVDRGILRWLMKDFRTPYQEIAKDLLVSSGTIHARIVKLKEAGVIIGSQVILDYAKLGLETMAFVGVNLANAGDYNQVLKILATFGEVTEVFYTTGKYNIFMKVVTETTKDLHLFLTEKLQPIKEVRSTETLISLDNPIARDPALIVKS